MSNVNPQLPINDEPVLADVLGRQDFVRRMAEVIQQCQPPQVFGLHGDWGAGKTSAMHQLHKTLAGVCPQNPRDEKDAKRDKKATVEVVWFEAWRYEHEKAPIVALIQEIRTHFSLTRSMVNQAGKIISVAIRSLLDLDFVTDLLGGVSAEKIEKHGEKWEKQRLATALPTHVIREQLTRAIGELIGKGRRLVVLVDDLDRCEPQAAYKLLEGIKIYLNLPNCVFVLGMNQQVIERAIAANLKDEMGDSQDAASFRMFRAREYLEKICQDLWHLPAVPDVAEYLEQCMAGFDLAAVFRDVAAKTRCLPPNPRKIKALANVLRRYALHTAYTARFNPKDKGAYQEDYLMMLAACLYYFHPEIYKRIELFPEFVIELDKWARGTPSQHELLKHLKLPDQPVETPQAATPGQQTRIPTFYDPSRSDAFLLKSLLEKTLGGVTPENFQKVMLHASVPSTTPST